MAERLTDYEGLLRAILTRLQDSKPRFLIGIAGPPATGKSTLAEKLVADLGNMGHATRFCPMDGFHLTNAQLDAAGLRCAKGRIDTFDATAFADAVSNLKRGAPFWWPHYSRGTHEPVPEGTKIDGTEAAYVIEGNYILADRDPWRVAANALDLRIFVDAEDDTLRARLVKRHRQSGRSEREARDKIATTDFPNAQAIRQERLVPDIIFDGAGSA